MIHKKLKRRRAELLMLHREPFAAAYDVMWVWSHVTLIYAYRSFLICREIAWTQKHIVAGSAAARAAGRCLDHPPGGQTRHNLRQSAFARSRAYSAVGRGSHHVSQSQGR